jgi:integrase
MLKALGLKRPAVSLHSFRHTLTVKLAQARTFPPLQQRLLGHSLGKDVESRVYLAGLAFSVKELSAALEVVKFPTGGGNSQG